MHTSKKNTGFLPSQNPNLQTTELPCEGDD